MTHEEFLAAGEPEPSSKSAEKPGLTGAFTGAVSRGLQQTWGLAYEGLPALVYSMVGDEEAAAEKLQQLQARFAKAQRDNPTLVADYTGIDSPTALATYVVEAIGENLPSMIPGLGVAGIGAGLGRAAIKKGATEAAEAFAKRQATGTAAGMTAGAVAGSAAQNIPETFADVAQETGQQRPGVAMAFGGLKAGLDAIPSVMALKRAFGPAITDKIAGNILKRMGVGAAEQFAAEGATEAGQEALDIAAARYVDENRELFTKENLVRIADAGLKGGLGGATLGGLTGAIQRPGTPTSDQPGAPDTGPVLSDTHRQYLREMGLSDQAINEDLARAQVWAERIAARRAADTEPFRPSVEPELPTSEDINNEPSKQERRAAYRTIAGVDAETERRANEAAGIAAGEINPAAASTAARVPPPGGVFTATSVGVARPGDVGGLSGIERLTQQIGANPAAFVQRTLGIPESQFRVMPQQAQHRLLVAAMEQAQVQQPGPTYQVQDTSGQGPTSAAPAPMREARGAPYAGAAENPEARVQPTSAEIDATGGQRINPRGPAPTGVGIGGSERPFPAGPDSSGLDFGNRRSWGAPRDPEAEFFERRANEMAARAKAAQQEEMQRRQEAYTRWRQADEARKRAQNEEDLRRRYSEGQQYRDYEGAYREQTGQSRWGNADYSFKKGKYTPHPKPFDAEGNYPVDENGFVTSTGGGPIVFPTQKAAGRWILDHGNKRGRQVFEPANHPGVNGKFTVYQRGMTEPEQGPGPESGGAGPSASSASSARPALAPPVGPNQTQTPGRPSPGQAEGPSPEPTAAAPGAAPVSPDAPQPAPDSPLGPAATKPETKAAPGTKKTQAKKAPTQPQTFPNESAGPYKDLRNQYSQDTGMSGEPRVAMDWLIRKGKETGNEHIVIVDKNGRVLSAGTANKPTEVAISAAGKNAMAVHGSNLVMHHNHPVETGLSRTDTRVATLPGVRWVVAYTPTGLIDAAGPSEKLSAFMKTSSENTLGKIRTGISNAINTVTSRIAELDGPLSRRAGVVIPDDEYRQSQIVQVLVGRTLERAGLINHIYTIPIDKKLLDAFERHEKEMANEIIRQFVQVLGFDGNSELFDRPTPQVSTNRALAAFSEGHAGLGSDTERAGAERGDRGGAGGFDATYPDRLEDEGRGRFSRKAPGFYSALTDAVQNLSIKSAPAAQWQGAINNLTTKGVKQAEIDWSMINDWLGKQTGPVSKEQVLQHLRDNEVQVEEVVRGNLDAEIKKAEEEYRSARQALREAYRDDTGTPAPTGMSLDLLEFLRENGGSTRENIDDFFASDLGLTPSDNLRASATRMWKASEALDGIDDSDGPAVKYGNYTLPGGENYRELLLTLPAKPAKQYFVAYKDGSGTIGSGYASEQEARASMEEVFGDRPDLVIVPGRGENATTVNSRENYRSGHFDEPNIVAHVRFNERTDADGRRVLFIEEIQSDWHQQGKREGYRLPSSATTSMDAEYRALVHKNNDARNAGRQPEPRDVARAFELEAALIKADTSKIPDAPFKTQWPELAFKRALRWAAENGFDRVAWTTGEQQADRYNLSKQVDSIEVRDVTGTPGETQIAVDINTKGDFSIGLTIDANAVVKYADPDTFEGKRLDEIVGKDMADKIMAGGTQTISGDGLKMGGEGMRGFYDKMLPAMASKLGKKYGASVGKTKLSQGPRDEVGFIAHSMDITPAMKTSVMGRGMPMWAIGKRPSKTRAGSPGGGAASATIQQRPETSDQRKQATDSLRAILRKLAGDKIDVKVVDRIVGDDANFDDAAGFFTADEGRRIIYIAMANPDEMAAVLRHETIHALRDLGIIGPKDWRTLENQAAGWRKKYQTDKYYGGLDLSQEKLNEEAIAEAYADWVRGQYKPTSVVENVFRQIRAFFEALRNWAQGNGWQTAEDVFEAIEGGAMSEAEFARTPLTRNNAFNRATPGARVFYRGTNPGDERRIVSPFEDGSVFMADNIDDARLYGSSIERIEAKPDAKILTENTAEFSRVTGRRNVLRSLRKGQSYADGLREAAAAARKAGFDAVQFEHQGDVGTVVLNNSAFNRGSNNAFAMSRAALKAQANQTIDLIKTVRDWADRLGNPLATLPDWESFYEKRGLTKGVIQDIQDGVAKMREIVGLPKEQREAAMRFMATQGASPSMIKDEKQRALFVKAKQQIIDNGQKLVDLGLLPEDVYRQNKGKYLPRMYLKFLLDEDADRRAAGSGAKPSDMGHLKHKKDIPEDIRKILYGEIDDPGFLAARSISVVASDIAKLQLLQDISENSNWVAEPRKQLVEWRGKKYTPQGLKAQADSLRTRIDEMPQDRRDAAMKMADDMDRAALTKLKAQPVFSKDYKQIPDTRRWGALRGLWVRKEIYDDMQGTFAIPNPDPSWPEQLLGMGGWGTKITQAWKTGKVVLNPPSVIRNLLSGVVQANVLGRVPIRYLPVRYLEAAKDIAAGGKYWQIYHKYGGKGSAYAQNEMARINRDYLALQKAQGTGRVRAMARFKDLVAHIADKASDAYQLVETIGKVSVIIDAMERGKLSERDAMIRAEEAQFDYSNVPPWMRYLRNSPVGVPFITYAGKVLPALLKTAVTRPVAFTPYIALAIGLPMLFRHMNDIDMEEWEKLKKVLPEWARQSGVYILPIRDSAGRWHYLDMNYIMPWGMLTQAWNKTVDGKPGDALKGVGLFGAPLFGIATAITTGIDPFTNRPIVQKGDPPWRQYQDTMLYAMGMAMPPWLAFGDVNAGWAKKLWQAANNEAIDRRGNPTSTLTQALGRTVGINLYGLDPEADRQKAIRQKKFEIDEIKRRRGTVAKDQRLKPDEKKEYLDDLNTLIREKSLELAEYTRSTNVAPKLRVPAQ